MMFHFPWLSRGVKKTGYHLLPSPAAMNNCQNAPWLTELYVQHTVPLLQFKGSPWLLCFPLCSYKQVQGQSTAILHAKLLHSRNGCPLAPHIPQQAPLHLWNHSQKSMCQAKREKMQQNGVKLTSLKHTWTQDSEEVLVCQRQSLVITSASQRNSLAPETHFCNTLPFYMFSHSRIPPM